MQKWIIGLLVLALIVYAGRAAVHGFERAVQDNERAKAEMAEHLAKQRAAEITRTIEAGQAARAEELRRATEQARN
jgi:predicted Holliday junction resolvase-like endonuclease